VDQGIDRPPGLPIDEGRGPVGGLFHSVAQLVATVIGVAQTRLELLSTELQEEVHRVAEIAILSAVALIAAGAGLFLLALAVIFVFWDTHRVAASVGVTATFFAISVVAALVLRAKVRAKPPLLDATLAELKKDRAHLLRRQGP
jgi:uncharacterized membrane protein YqjE